MRRVVCEVTHGCARTLGASHSHLAPPTPLSRSQRPSRQPPSGGRHGRWGGGCEGSCSAADAMIERRSSARGRRPVWHAVWSSELRGPAHIPTCHSRCTDIHRPRGHDRGMQQHGCQHYTLQHNRHCYQSRAQPFIASNISRVPSSRRNMAAPSSAPACRMIFTGLDT